MRVFEGLESLPKSKWAPIAATIGNFYAVHKGHQALIRRVDGLAKSSKSVRTVVTFEPHPQKVLRGVAPPVLVTAQEKLELLNQAGVQQVVILPFTQEFSKIEPEEFVRDILVGTLKLKALVVGANFRFGRFARGDVPMLRSFSKSGEFTFQTARMVELAGRSISTTEIRHALEEGDVAWANKALGRVYALPGKIARGMGRGKKLGYPTANMKTEEGLVVPGAGIYAGFVVLGKKRLPAAISIGHNPTFGEHPLSVEAYVLDFEGDLYSEPAKFEFTARLRDHIEFPSAAALKEAMAGDVAEVRRLLIK